MVVGGGFGPPAFTARVTGLQPAAFSHFAYPTSCASALGSGGRIRTSDGFTRRINNPLAYHSATPEQNAVHAFFITHQLSKIKN